MKCPVVIPVGGKSFRIRYLLRLDDPDDFGDFCPETFEIRVSRLKCKNPEDVWSTIWHELGHGCLKLSGWTRVLTIEEEEGIVESFEHMIAPLMVLKPKAPGLKWREIRFPFES